MKKSLLKILTAVCLIIATVMTFVGCGGAGTVNVSLKTPGEVLSNAGFLVETENYVYFINGVEEESADNKYGEPIKGALMVADKNDLSNVEVVVPKLMVAKDYDAGIYIYGDYVYFATPTTKKNTSGEIAYAFVDFCKAKLDGSETVELFSVSGVSLQYRIVEVDSVVYVVYYDVGENDLLSINTETKETTMIKEDVESFFFMDNETAKDLVVTYTISTEKEWTSENDEPTTYKYNKIYGYKAGEAEAKLLLDGEVNASGDLDWKNIAYTINMTANGYVYYSSYEVYETDANMQTKYYAVKGSDFYATGKTNAVRLNANASTYIVDTSLLVNPSEVYFVETVGDNTFISVDSLTTVESLVNKEVVAKAAASSIIAVEDGFVYFTNADSKIVRVAVGGDEEQVVTPEGAKTDWYRAKFVDGKMFYFDAEYSLNYVHYVDVSASADIKREDTDEDGEVDSIYLAGKVLIGEIASKDKVAKVSAIINSLSEESTIVFDEGEELKVSAIEEARSAFDGLTADEQKQISKEDRSLLENYELALEVSKKLYALKDFEYADSDDARNEFEDEYNLAKEAVDKLVAEENSTVLGMLAKNGRWYLQQAGKFFD